MAASVSGAAGHSANSLAEIHSALASSGGGNSSDNGSGLAFGTGHSLVSGSAPQNAAAGHAPVSFAGQNASPTGGGPVVTQDIHGGGVVLNLHDGSTISVVGTLHVDPGLFK
jgi:hypothetical protein